MMFLLGVFIFLSIFTGYAAGPKYIFYFIGDGMGFNHIEATRQYCQSQNDGNIKNSLVFLQFPVQSVVTTFSATNRVTDSAAAATALATGTKTYNGAIGLDVDKKPLESVAKKLKKEGMKVGILTSVSVDHATPAGFYANQPNRNMGYEIGIQAAESEFDFFAGSAFTKPINKKDPNDKNVYTALADNGYVVCRGEEEYNRNRDTKKKMVLLSADSLMIDALPYMIDRKPGDTALPFFTAACIEQLSKDNKKGFFMMVEGGEIDWAAHANDGATVVNEVIDFGQAIQVAYEFYKKHPKETLIVITADHETGGCILGNGTMDVNTEYFANQKMSGKNLSAYLKEVKKNNPNISWDEMKQILSAETGLWKTIPVTLKEEAKLMTVFDEMFHGNSKDVRSLYASIDALATQVVALVNKKAHVSWASGNHSASQVPLFAIGVGSDKFSRRLDNTDIPKIILQLKGLK